MTSLQIPPDVLPRARQIIQPMVGTEDEREALLTEAFYVYDPPDDTPSLLTLWTIPVFGQDMR